MTRNYVISDIVLCSLFIVCCLLKSVLGHVFDESLSRVRADSDASTQQEAVAALIQRVVGNRSDEFEVRVVPQLLLSDGKDVFKIFKAENGTVVNIEGSSGVAAAWGFHHYLKYSCNCHISWNDNQLNLPSLLPPADIHKTANDRFRYYQNVCTTSYSFVWWNWAKWELHIDWMALNGINLALAFHGQEAIWQRVYMKLNMTKEEIDEHFTGPAFFAWGRMGNIRGWSGPLSDAWHAASLMLQKQILSRMRSLGIVPVLPAFAGHVPRALKRLYPNINFTLATRWNHFEDKYCCPYLLSPEEPLFKVIGSMFLQEVIKEFGTNHIYNCDTFNEMPPATGDLDFLRTIGQSIYQSMTQEDEAAVWMLQGWIFYNEISFWTKERAEALLKSVPIGKMLVLDLMSELNPQFGRLDSYFGQPYIWCMLHNFGGTLGMHGTAKRVNQNTFEARNSPNSSMIGIGLTMEGINQNYVMYDLMMEMGWREEPVDLVQWFRNYSSRRYGQDNIHLDNMWQLLKDSVYNYQSVWQQHGRYIVVRRPTLSLKSDVWYNISHVMTAWDESMYSVEISPYLAQVKTFKHDLVDLTRQALQLKIDSIYKEVVKAYTKKDALYLRWHGGMRTVSHALTHQPLNIQNLGNLSLVVNRQHKTLSTLFDGRITELRECGKLGLKVCNATSIFLELMSDLDQLLASNKWFLLGPWLESAKQRASTPQERKQFEAMARNQITLWGPNGEITDYACKQWAHLMANYYIPRWELFFRALESAVLNKIPFNQGRVNAVIFREVEQPFTFGEELYPTFEIGDSFEISKTLHKKWRYV